MTDVRPLPNYEVSGVGGWMGIGDNDDAVEMIGHYYPFI
jgi:hypothetical protein